MSVKVAINGFGRIGRLAFRQMFGAEGYEIVAINDLTSPDMLAHLLKYDSAQKRYDKADTVVAGEDSITVDGKTIKIYAEKDAANLPWGEIGVDVVLECTGFYCSKAKSMAHINAGAKKVIISAPAKGDLKTIVYNVNDDIRIQFLKVRGLPQKISGSLYDNVGLSWWDNDIKSIGEKLIFGVSKDLFKEVYNIVTSKNFKLPKFNKAQFDIAGTGYEFNNPKELSIAMQAGYMRLVNKYHYENSQMYPEYKSYELQFKNNIDGESVLKTWLDKKGYKLINDIDFKPTNMSKMLHTLKSHCTCHTL